MQFVQPRITKSERITRGRVQERRIAAAPARAGRLTQAVLAKAFRGELVPTEAELSRAEGRTFEPASALLERVRAEAVGAVAPRRRKRS